jgi:hypothetical protein
MMMRRRRRRRRRITITIRRSIHWSIVILDRNPRISSIQFNSSQKNGTYIGMMRIRHWTASIGRIWFI